MRSRGAGRRSDTARDPEVTCELTAEGAEALFALADDLGRFAADLWFDGKLEPLPDEDGPDEAPAGAPESSLRGRKRRSRNERG